MPSERDSSCHAGFFRRLAVPLIAGSVPVLLLTSAIRIEMNSLGLYLRGFRVYAVSQTTGLDAAQLQQAARELIRYFNSLAATPQMMVSKATGAPFELFHDYELIHLADVKVLFAVNSVLQALSLLVVVTLVLAGLSLGRRAMVLRALRLGAVVTLALLAATGFLFLTDFSGMFVLFHVVAFDNSFWLLDPLKDYLVMLFPFGFWQDMFLVAGAGTGIAAVALYVLAGLPERPSRSLRTNTPHVASTTRDV